MDDQVEVQLDPEVTTDKIPPILMTSHTHTHTSCDFSSFLSLLCAGGRVREQRRRLLQVHVLPAVWRCELLPWKRSAARRKQEADGRTMFLFVSRQDMEISVPELRTILNRVVSKRE